MVDVSGVGSTTLRRLAALEAAVKLSGDHSFTAETIVDVAKRLEEYLRTGE